MLLGDQNSHTLRGSGSVDGPEARAFAREGARVFLAGRTLATSEEVATENCSASGEAETARIAAKELRL
jgi:3-oxoacyl-[acyl-carrier protein] reductase